MQEETRVTPWRPFQGPGVTACRIWARRTPFGLFQRHEWRRPDGATWREAWIPSGQAWPHGAQVTTEDPPAIALALEALQLIAAGHNDARQLAADTLKKMAQAG